MARVKVLRVCVWRGVPGVYLDGIAPFCSELLRKRGGVPCFSRLEKVSYCSRSSFVLSRFRSSPNYSRHTTVLSFFLPGSCLFSKQDASLVDFDFQEVFSRVVFRDKSRATAVAWYSSHDDSRDSDLWSFGRMERAGLWMWWFRCSLTSCFTLKNATVTFPADQHQYARKSMSKSRIIWGRYQTRPSLLSTPEGVTQWYK